MTTTADTAAQARRPETDVAAEVGLGTQVKVVRVGDLLHIQLRANAPPNEFIVTPMEASALRNALEKALAGTTPEPDAYPLWAKSLALLVAVGLPTGFLLSWLRPASDSDILVPAALTAWALLAMGLKRRERRLAHSG